MPVRNVTSLTFGGPYLDELYITTAGGREGAMGLEGALFRVKAGAFGRLEYRSKIWPV